MPSSEERADTAAEVSEHPLKGLMHRFLLTTLNYEKRTIEPH